MQSVIHFFDSGVSSRLNLAYNVSSLLESGFEVIVIGRSHLTRQLPEPVQIFDPGETSTDYTAYARLICSEGFDLQDTLFVNSSARGPFLPSWITTPFSQLLKRKLNGNAIIGSSINHLPKESEHARTFIRRNGKLHGQFASHAQTFAFALSIEALKITMEGGIWSSGLTNPSRDIAISDYEIGLSQLILNSGGSLSSFQADPANSPLPSELLVPRDGDTAKKSGLAGFRPNPFESVFIKTNRNIFSDEELISLGRIKLSSFAKNLLDDFDLGRKYLQYLGVS